MSGTNFSQADLDAIAQATAKYNLPSWVLPGIAYRETRGEANPDTAVSSTGALGLMQVLPSTADAPGYGVSPVARSSLTDPYANADFAGAYISGLYNNSGSWDSAINQYSGGGYNTAAVQSGAALMPSGSSAGVASGQPTPVGQELTNAQQAYADGGASSAPASAPGVGTSQPGWLNAAIGAAGAFLDRSLIVGFGITLIIVALVFMFMEAKTTGVPWASLKGAV